VTHDPASGEAVEEFFRLRRAIRRELEKLDGQLRDMAHTNPDRAEKILHALSRSGVKDDRDAAAIYVGHLLTTRPDNAKSIIQLLLHDPDDDIRFQAQDTLNAAIDNNTITATEATQLHQRWTSGGRA
jgi:hypothetical protein